MRVGLGSIIPRAIKKKEDKKGYSTNIALYLGATEHLCNEAEMSFHVWKWKKPPTKVLKNAENILARAVAWCPSSGQGTLVFLNAPELC